MRLLAFALVLLIALIQNPLWFGKGGWLRVWELDRQVEGQRQANVELTIRNSALDAEVMDLKQGYEAIEERARSELGMVKAPARGTRARRRGCAIPPGSSRVAADATA
jgi:cell division protein FtsB